MLVGELAPTAGGVRLYGFDTGAARRKARQLVGYTPQGDALLDLLTPRETLVYYARLNGTPDEQAGAVADAMVAALDLTVNAHTQCRHLSGGNKRRLSLALAYIGAPLIVAIDEATTGVDPAARRRMFEGEGGFFSLRGK